MNPKKDYHTWMNVILMGVSGVGKTAVGQRLADAMQLTFVDADDFHPVCNVQKMSQGIPLTDQDRWPWLDSLNIHLKNQHDGCVLACSALRAVYRDQLIDGLDDVRLVYLKADKQTLLKRMQQREHFMPESLLTSQLATWEEPHGSDILTVDATLPLEDVVAHAMAALSR